MSKTIPCPDCGGRMELKQGSHGMFFGCTKFPHCRGAHTADSMGRPLGTPADAETRKLRMAVHAALDKLWRRSGNQMTRRDAYVWLRDAMRMNAQQAHIGGFTEEQCRKALSCIQEVIG